MQDAKSRNQNQQDQQDQGVGAVTTGIERGEGGWERQGNRNRISSSTAFNRKETVTMHEPNHEIAQLREAGNKG